MEDFKIINSTLNVVDTILKLYDDGTAYQKTVAKTLWKGFERQMVEKEIAEINNGK